MSDTKAGEIHSGKAPEPLGAYPHARRAGPFVFLSGIGPRVRGSREIPGVDPFDFEAQCRNCFRNVQAVVADAGLPWTSVVDVTVYLVDMKRDFPTYNRIYAEFFGGDGNPNPARTTLQIVALPTPIAVEVKAVCFAP
ncbi:MAG: RidA family protein [Phycisphaerae bacterium]|nr:RidA family protein [Planctomycetota bacterium]MBM4101588.1 RidA family protein [Phycisphaerae bacterium]